MNESIPLSFWSVHWFLSHFIYFNTVHLFMRYIGKPHHSLAGLLTPLSRIWPFLYVDSFEELQVRAGIQWGPKRTNYSVAHHMHETANQKSWQCTPEYAIEDQVARQKPRHGGPLSNWSEKHLHTIKESASQLGRRSCLNAWQTTRWKIDLLQTSGRQLHKM